MPKIRLALIFSLCLVIQGVAQYPKASERKQLRDRLISVNKDIAEKGLISIPGKNDQFLTGYAYKTLYDWDVYFENLYLSHYGVSEYCFTNMKLFLSVQHPDGYVPRIYNDSRWGCFKPFLAQLAVLGSRQKNDFSWLSNDSLYYRLVRFVNWYFQKADFDGNGLPTWQSAGHSGMDNQFRRSGNDEGGRSSNFDEGVDLACYLYREWQALAIIATELGKNKDSENFFRKAAKLKQTINTVFWDEKDGFYYDRHERTGKKIAIRSVAGFLPMWAGIASKKQAKRLVKDHLLNKNEFWLKYPVASWAATEPDYEQGTKCTNGECNWRGTTWIPTNYMILHGLMDYGFKREAHLLAKKTFSLVLDMNHATREYYDGDTGVGNGMNPFWGWSTLGYVMLYEETENYNPMSLTSKIKPLLMQKLDVQFFSH